MNTALKFTATAIAFGLFALASESALAQSYLDASSKARGDYGQASQNTGRTSRLIYSAAAPSELSNVASEPSPAAKTEPTAVGKQTDESDDTANTDRTDTQTSRRDWYEPERNSYERGSFSTGSRGSGSATPLYLVPKSLR
jgi:hypothetical protein